MSIYMEKLKEWEEDGNSFVKSKVLGELRENILNRIDKDPSNGFLDVTLVEKTGSRNQVQIEIFVGENNFPVFFQTNEELNKAEARQDLFRWMFENTNN